MKQYKNPEQTHWVLFRVCFSIFSKRQTEQMIQLRQPERDRAADPGLDGG